MKIDLKVAEVSFEEGIKHIITICPFCGKTFITKIEHADTSLEDYTFDDALYELGEKIRSHLKIDHKMVVDLTLNFSEEFTVLEVLSEPILEGE